MPPLGHTVNSHGPVSLEHLHDYQQVIFTLVLVTLILVAIILGLMLFRWMFGLQYDHVRFWGYKVPKKGE